MRANILKFLLIQLFLFSASFYSCSGQSEENEGERYTEKSPSYSGTGKYYMGREIAYVMGYQGIDWLERSDREEEENTSLLLENMNIQSDDVIADIGAGSGYHTFKMAKMASQGTIYAVDIQREMLQAIEKKKTKTGIDNVKAVKGNEQSVNLPKNKIHKVLMVDVYHEFSFPFEMMQSIKSALTKDGLIYLIEYRAEDQSVPIKKLHKMSEKQAIKEMENAGFELVKNISNLPWQHCMIFKIKARP